VNPDRNQSSRNPPPSFTDLLERIVEGGNVVKAWKRVKQNGGSAGVDRMSIEGAGPWLREHWPKVRMSLLSGRYHPSPVRPVEIPKPDGGVRKLGIPTVVDRLIQQCILQILQPELDPMFHDDSYGFRPGRSAHQAICRAQALVNEGRKWCVDVDLEKFFDRVNHDVLMDRVGKRIKDRRVVKLIFKFLKAGILNQEVVMEREEGTPQGGPLSPFLANLLLDEVDWELERRGLAFVRYADDCNVYVRSKRAAENAMVVLEKLFTGLRLKINREKSAVARAWERKILGYRFWISVKGVQKAAAKSSIEKLRSKVRDLTSRTSGRSVETTIGELSRYLRGWKEYFRLADTPKVFRELDSWIRRRLRMIYLKQWKRGKTWYRELVARGLPQQAAASIAATSRSYWRMAASSGVSQALPTRHFVKLGLITLGD
jgi:RNA-directed DNA polymerase